MPFQVQVAVLALDRNIGCVYVLTGNLKKQEKKPLSSLKIYKGPKVCSKLIATSINYFEKKNTTPDNFKVENYNCMGFRNLTLKALMIDPPKLKGFSGYIHPSEGQRNCFHLLDNRVSNICWKKHGFKWVPSLKKK